MSAALAMAEGAAGVESAGGAEKATAAKSEAQAWSVWRGREQAREATARRGWHGVDTPMREGERAFDEPERKRPREGHPRVGDRRWRELSEHKKKTTK